MDNYYSTLLNSNNLKKCYEIAPERVKQFLKSEIEFVVQKINKNDTVLDLGCGYGRVMIKLAEKVKKVVGIDISKDNIQLAEKFIENHTNCELHVMDATDLKFYDNCFDKVICIQNGISAFNVNPLKLMQEAIRVTKNGGILLFSSYSEKFWNHRLEWFQIQSDQKLIGEIDYAKTKDGVICCKDGFKAITYSMQNFLDLASQFNVNAKIHEIDNSSIFCELVKN